MTYSSDLRWRAIVLSFICGVELDLVSNALGVSETSIKRWYQHFESNGDTSCPKATRKTARWSPEVLAFVESYVKEHPCFYIEELQERLIKQFPLQRNVSTSTICRALRFDLGLTRKVLTKCARERAPQEIKDFVFRLKPFYFGQEQLVFMDETSKDGR